MGHLVRHGIPWRTGDINEPENVALLREIELRGGEVKPKEIYPAIRKHFPEITDEDAPSSFVTRLQATGVEVIVAKGSNHRDG